MLFRVAVLRLIADKGYVDLKEQALPQIARHFAVRHLPQALRPPCRCEPWPSTSPLCSSDTGGGWDASLRPTPLPRIPAPPSPSSRKRRPQHAGTRLRRRHPARRLRRSRRTGDSLDRLPRRGGRRRPARCRAAADGGVTKSFLADHWREIPACRDCQGRWLSLAVSRQPPKVRRWQNRSSYSNPRPAPSAGRCRALLRAGGDGGGNPRHPRRLGRHRLHRPKRHRSQPHRLGSADHGVAAADSPSKAHRVCGAHQACWGCC